MFSFELPASTMTSRESNDCEDEKEASQDYVLPLDVNGGNAGPER